MQEAPQGIDKLVALAALGPEWRAKVLADPLAAAREAELELSDSERAIIASVPRGALAGMIVSFETAIPRPSGLGRLAAGAAAAALLSVALAGCGDGDDYPKPKGIQPDVPPKKSGKIEPAPSKPPDSDKALSEGVGEIPKSGLETTYLKAEPGVFGYREGERKKAVSRYGGHTADIPPPRKKPEETHSEENAK